MRFLEEGDFSEWGIFLRSVIFFEECDFFREVLF